jgi:hypothetical protein
VEGPRAWKPGSLDQHLVAKIVDILKIGPSAGFEKVVGVFPKAFPGTIVVPTEEEPLKLAIALYKGLSI